MGLGKRLEPSKTERDIIELYRAHLSGAGLTCLLFAT